LWRSNPSVSSTANDKGAGRRLDFNVTLVLRMAIALNDVRFWG